MGRRTWLALLRPDTVVLIINGWNGVKYHYIGEEDPFCRS